MSITDEVRSSKLKPSTVIKELDLQPSLEPVTGGDAFGDGDGTTAPAHCHDGAYFAGLKYVNHAALHVSTCIKSSFLHFPSFPMCALRGLQPCSCLRKSATLQLRYDSRHIALQWARAKSIRWSKAAMTQDVCLVAACALAGQ